MEMFLPRLKKLLKEWDVRVLVLLSLTLQIVLIILGNRRKYIHKHWIRIVVWSAYLAADYVATCALGVLSKNLSAKCEEDGGFLDSKNELTALWVPFLLLHLGGPDTITAYSLEDNELWLRHFLGLAAQTVTALYIFVAVSAVSHLSILFILLFLAGTVKYGERTWVLRSACETGSLSNNEKLKSDSDYFTASSTKFVEEEKVKNTEGYRVGVQKVIEIRHQVDPAFLDDQPISDKEIIVTAHGLLNLTQNFLLDATLSNKDDTRTVFRNMSSKNAFKVIESELGLIYDLLYTKSPLLYTRWGFVLRLITVFLTCSGLVFFTFLYHKHEYSKVDAYLTFLLLIVAIILEIYAAIVQLSSDRFVVWSSMQNKTSTLQALHSFLSIYKSPKWSNNMCQLSFLNFCTKGKSLPCYNIMKLFVIIDKDLESRWYVAYEDVPEKLKESIFSHLRSKAKGNHRDSSSISDVWEGESIGDYPKFWEELVNGILFWHIVTEVVLWDELDGKFSKEQIDADLAEQYRKFSKQISRYMLYLLVLHPSLLSATMEQIISFKNTFDQAADTVGGVTIEKQACQKLIQWHDQPEESDNRTKQEPKDEDEESKTERLKSSLLYNAVGCAKRVSTSEFKLDKWMKICETWLDILTFAARKCKGKEHAQQLRNGGELLTHVWLLMAHFGLTDHFTSESCQIIRLSAH